MKWLRSVIAAAVLVMFAAPAVGQDYDNVQMTWRGHSGVAAPYGVYVGPYHAMSGLAQGQIDIYCVDYYHWANTGQWYANYTGLGGGDLGSRTRYGMINGGTAARGAYAQAAYLANKMTPDNEAEWPTLHAAMWYIMSGAELGNGTMVMAQVREAETNAGSVDLSNWYVVTDVNVNPQNALNRYDHTAQEFLTRHSVVPEPATVILMGTGLIAVAGLTVVMRQSVG